MFYKQFQIQEKYFGRSKHFKYSIFIYFFHNYLKISTALDNFVEIIQEFDYNNNYYTNLKERSYIKICKCTNIISNFFLGTLLVIYI